MSLGMIVTRFAWILYSNVFSISGVTETFVSRDAIFLLKLKPALLPKCNETLLPISSEYHEENGYGHDLNLLKISH